MDSLEEPTREVLDEIAVKVLDEFLNLNNNNNQKYSMPKEYEIKYYINNSNTCTTTVSAPNTQTAAAIAKSMLPTANFVGQPREKR